MQGRHPSLHKNHLQNLEERQERQNYIQIAFFMVGVTTAQGKKLTEIITSMLHCIRFAHRCQHTEPHHVTHEEPCPSGQPLTFL